MAKGKSQNTAVKKASVSRNNAPRKPSDVHWKEAAIVVAEMMLHIGRGQSAVAAGGNQKYVDAIAAEAARRIEHDAFLRVYEGFLSSTAKSLANGLMNYRQGWRLNDATRQMVLLCSLQMGNLVQQQKNVANDGSPITYQELVDALRLARDRHCPRPKPGAATQGGGPTCSDF